ncbi:MAG TPA: metallophosphoesterase [Candidatus Limnocylindrales bacterium]|nr:metallophosphoesterase [Candidatus Limnocylindrales bacterium]
MIRRVKLTWPKPVPALARGGRPLRLLGVSDMVEPAFDYESNRTALEPLDAILGCGDLEPDYLGFLADAFHVPLLYVRGNHDRGSNWEALKVDLPRRIDGRVEVIGGIPIAGMSWPGDLRGQARRDGSAAWQQAFGLFARTRVRRTPTILLSHVPPRGLGDTPEDHYHRGFSAYHWLCRRINPVLWLHGHTSLAARHDWRVDWGSTTLINVTGAVLIEIEAPTGSTAEPEPAGVEDA